jgi:hypothetical protein
VDHWPDWLILLLLLVWFVLDRCSVYFRKGG